MVTPTSTFTNSSGGGTYNIETITVSDIDTGCSGKSFKVNLFDSSSSSPLNSVPLIVSAPAAGITSISVGQIFSTGSTKNASASVYRITVESQDGGGKDGLTSATASTSAYQIKTDFPTSADGLYWIQNANINSGNPVQIYADMTRNGGGWTLIVANGQQDGGWNSATTLLRNQISVPSDPKVANVKYSILQWADYIKKSSSGFQYRFEATDFGRWGGVFTANQAYSFVSTANTSTNITLNTKFDSWNYDNDGVEARMPWYSPGSPGLLTTSSSASDAWWGTIISGSGFAPAPWMASGNSSPGVIWYWVR